MFPRDSRYANTLSFEADTTETTPFEGTRPRELETPLGVLEHTLVEGDRLDLLALYYYNDPHKWWLILDANPSILNAQEVASGDRTGSVIVIPRGQMPGRPV